MVRTAFEPQLHGFAFDNSWAPDIKDERQLSDTSISHLKKGRLVKAIAFGVAWAFLHRDVRALSDVQKRPSVQDYGLCGGMCFAALDFYKAGPPALKEQIADDRPDPGTNLRRYIWRRQVDSLIGDGVRFVIWPLLLRIPATWLFSGGCSWLLTRSQKAWNTLKASLDGGKPVPLGLVRDTKDIFGNHQVLAIGYEEKSETEGAIYAYDPNYPNQMSIIGLKFGQHSLEGEENGNSSTKLRGFFCQAYKPADPREAIA